MVNIKSDWSSKQIKLSIIKIINIHVFLYWSVSGTFLSIWFYSIMWFLTRKTLKLKSKTVGC